ncbi:hypothetical protein EVAR_13849_1 [Eumeta japonica]|uniref:Mariner Mos1 transposase n=1 Tax=Eumeta variegata TaxID=151549 RepID=A0A4C1U1L2_EUMVA|nr:hypothetical protein EVAR_13849_1 [Eumeta japonica]
MRRDGYDCGDQVRRLVNSGEPPKRQIAEIAEIANKFTTRTTHVKELALRFTPPQMASAIQNLSYPLQWTIKRFPNEPEVLALRYLTKSARVTLENSERVKSFRWTVVCLPEVFKEIRKNNQQRRVILHHDSASCHTSAETTRFLDELTGHPPYSPDLAPNDFYLFPRRYSPKQDSECGVEMCTDNEFRAVSMEVPRLVGLGLWRSGPPAFALCLTITTP